MDPINYFIVILLIIGILLLIKNHIKNKTKEAFSSSIYNMSGDINDDDDEKEVAPEINLTPKKDADGYELVGSVPPPSYKDGVYDFNLKYAKQIWEDMGCNPQSKYAPTVDNKTTLFGKNIGWAREDYKFRVKSMQVEANKAEYNYYDWGKYKKSDTDAAMVTGKEDNANKWIVDKNKMKSDWAKTINRPEIVKYPMGIRKSRALCNGEDPGDYSLPKKGDKVKIKNKVNYGSPYFSGIVVGHNGTEIANDNDPIEVLWYQKGTATVDTDTNKITNFFSDEDCGTTSLDNDTINCTRTETEKEDVEVIIDKEKVRDNSIGWKLYGTNGADGQESWFGSPNLDGYTIDGSKRSGKPDSSEDILGNIPNGGDGTKWSDRYRDAPYNIRNIIPKNLISYDTAAKTKTFNMENNADNSIDPKSVFKIEECQKESACEDLRCDAIVDKIKKKYPLTNVCNLEKRNTFSNDGDRKERGEGTDGQYCTGGTNKGAAFTYYDENLCSFQDYGDNIGDKPKNFCKTFCGERCKSINKLDRGANYIEVFSGKDYNGHKAIVLIKDGRMDAHQIFPAAARPVYIKSIKIHGPETVVLLSPDKNSLDPTKSDDDGFVYVEKHEVPNLETYFNDNANSRQHYIKKANAYIKGGGMTIAGCSAGGGSGCHKLTNVSLKFCKDYAMAADPSVKSFDWNESSKTCWLNDNNTNVVNNANNGDDYYVKDYIKGTNLRYIDVCKKKVVKIPDLVKYIPNNSSQTETFQTIVLGGNFKIKYLNIKSIQFGDQNWGYVTSCKIRGIKSGGGNTEIGSMSYMNVNGNMTNSGVSKRSGNSKLGTYGKEYNTYKKKVNIDPNISRNIARLEDILIKDKKTHNDLQCDSAWPYLFLNMPIFGTICVVMKIKIAILSGQIDVLKKQLNKATDEMKSATIPTTTPKIINEERYYKLSGNKSISSIVLYPSKIGSGHETLYKSDGGEITIFYKV